jgi:hypothetical protein
MEDDVEVARDPLEAAKSGLPIVDAAKSGFCKPESAKFDSTSDDPASRTNDVSASEEEKEGEGGYWGWARKDDFIIESNSMESVGCAGFGCRER